MVGRGVELAVLDAQSMDTSSRSEGPNTAVVLNFSNTKGWEDALGSVASARRKTNTSLGSACEEENLRAKTVDNKVGSDIAGHRQLVKGTAISASSSHPMSDLLQTQYIVFLPPSPRAIKRDVSLWRKTAWPEDAAPGKQKSGKAKWRRIECDGHGAIASSRDVRGYSETEHEGGGKKAVDGEASRFFSRSTNLRGSPKARQIRDLPRVQAVRNSASSSKSVSDAIPSGAGPSARPTTNPTTTTGDTTRDPFQITPSTGRRSTELPLPLSGRMKAEEDTASQPQSQSLPFHHSASVVPSSSDDEVGQLVGSSEHNRDPPSDGLRSSSPLVDQIFHGRGTRRPPPPQKQKQEQPQQHDDQEESAAITEATTTLSLELPKLRLQFDPLKFLSVGDIIANATRYVSSYYLDPNNLRNEGLGFGAPGPGPAAGDQRFSVLAIVRDVGPLQDARIWRKVGARGFGGGDATMPDIMDICEIQLMGTRMEPLTLIVQHSLAWEWAGEEEEDEGSNMEEGSFRGSTGGAPLSTTRATPDAGGVTMALMETMDTSGAGGAFKGKGQHQRPGARQAAAFPKNNASSASRQSRAVKIRAGDVVALRGLTLKPIIPKKENRVKQLGVTRRMQPVSTSTTGNAQGQAPWEGVRAIANGENNPREVGMEICWRNDVRNKADEKYRFDSAFAQFDAKYERVYELASLWDNIKPRYA